MSLPEERDEVAFRWSTGRVATSTLVAFVSARATSSAPFGQGEYGNKSSWISFRVRKATRKQRTNLDKSKCRKPVWIFVNQSTSTN